MTGIEEGPGGGGSCLLIVDTDTRRGDTAGPDFICAGMQKAGTQWLYDQLQYHPEFWMPPVKELHFFDQAEPRQGFINQRNSFVSDPIAEGQRRVRQNLRPLDLRDSQFFAAFDQITPQWRSLDAYARLFEPKGNLLSGDVTPGYSTLEMEFVAELARTYPLTRAVIVIREPAARVLSQLRMDVAAQRQPASSLTDPDELEAYLEIPRVKMRTFPSEIVPRWQSAFGERFALFYFDDLAEDPIAFRSRILTHVGAQDAHASTLPPDYNRKARSSPLAVSEAVRLAAERLLADERRRCADLFGGRALEWPGRLT